MGKIRIGFAGLGDHSLRAHVKHLAERRDYLLVAGYDPSAQSFKNAETQTQTVLESYRTFEKMISSGTIDAVLISSPDCFHSSQLSQAVEAGLHVFCEKPLCTNESEIIQLRTVLQSAVAKELVVTSCHPRRFDPPYVWAKKNLGALQAEFGKILSVTLDFSYHIPSDAKSGLHGGSLLQDHANHEIDYVSFLLGSSCFTVHKLRDEFDHYAMSGVRDDGVSFQFFGTRRLTGSKYPEWIKLRFERGEVVIDTYEQGNSYTLSHETGKQTKITPGATDYDVRFSSINANWIDAIRGRKANYLSGASLVRNSALSVYFHGQDTWRCEI